MNWTKTTEWASYSNEPPSCGATLRVFGCEDEWLLVRADAWTGDFDESGVLSRHRTFEEATFTVYAEANRFDD